MFRQLKKTLVATLIAALTAGQMMPAFADSAESLPDMGTSAGSTLSIGQELQMGDYYVRQLRGSAPLINDPLLVQYINSLGMRLVSHADSVKTPFHFYLINNDEINAFAFFGGNVVLHSALFRYADNESQLASVMAHEISHVTQRHLARAMEDQKRSAPLTWVGALGSILLAMASPQAGMAALTGTLAGTRQGMNQLYPTKRTGSRPHWYSGAATLRVRSAGDAGLPRKITRSGALLLTSTGNFADPPPAGEPSVGRP
ncbi:Putative Zn-dependent protease, contains TPR repeats [Leclercia adecarboxylata]|uniref:Zn-dependent protease, contains TPR repeats n=1 Tax=Leclercia adecarboxylata TaxID=83655 RepID=A0A4U9I8Y5_9ENTR|nr:Putative Zn-dependent protease, contains TPR repeats [Leclercia adecarboxylata]